MSMGSLLKGFYFILFYFGGWRECLLLLLLLFCICVHAHTGMWELLEAKGIGSPRATVVEGCEPPCAWVHGTKFRSFVKTIEALECLSHLSSSLGRILQRIWAKPGMAAIIDSEKIDQLSPGVQGPDIRRIPICVSWAPFPHD